MGTDICGVCLGRHRTEQPVLFHFLKLLVYTVLHLNITFLPWKYEHITVLFIKMGEVILNKLAKSKWYHLCQIPAA